VADVARPCLGSDLTCGADSIHDACFPAGVPDCTYKGFEERRHAGHVPRER
jgi:hypothetical protein